MNPFQDWMKRASRTRTVGAGAFFDKPPIFGVEVSSSSDLPVAAGIRCEILNSRMDDRGEQIIDVRLLDGVESDDGTARFDVRSDDVERT